MTSRVIRALTARSLLDRDETFGDRRAFRVIVTVRGEQLLDRATPQVEAASAQFFAARVDDDDSWSSDDARRSTKDVVGSAAMDWRELHLSRRSRVFNFAHRWLKVLAIGTGFPATTVCLMALAARFTHSFEARLAVAVAVALAVPATIAWLAKPKEDPLIAVGLPSETYALILLGFAVGFVIVAHRYTQSLLVREGDREACENVYPLPHAAWFLGGVRAPAQTLSCGGTSQR